MTRISSFELYQCKACGQIHMHPQYTSYNISSPPANLILDLKAERTCRKCEVRTTIENYQYVGKTRAADKAPIEWANPPTPSQESLFTKLLSFFKKAPNPKSNFCHFGI